MKKSLKEYRRFLKERLDWIEEKLPPKYREGSDEERKVDDLAWSVGFYDALKLLLRAYDDCFGTTPTMKITYAYISSQTGVSLQYVQQCGKTRKRPNWKRAKQFAAVTGTTPELWLEGTPEQIRAALENKCNEPVREDEAA